MSGRAAETPGTVHAAVPGVEAFREEILRAFDLKPWHVGLAPVPRRVRIWNRITFRRWRVRIADWLDREN